ncbi:MAG: carotenoid oxygenase family protein [Actinomycetota bacterium]
MVALKTVIGQEIPARPVTSKDDELAVWSWNAWRPTSVEDDYEITDIDGEIPADLNGTLYRNGPSQQIQPGGDYTRLHFFDGDGLVHAFRIEDGRAWYRDRFVRNQSFVAEQQARVTNQHHIGPRADVGVAPVMPRRTSNTNAVYHAGRLLAMVENGLPFEIDARTLDPIGDYDFGGSLLAPWVSAHPKTDGRTGQMLIHGYFIREPYLQVYIVEPDGSVSFRQPVAIPYPAFLHDLAITDNHFIVPIHPIVLEVPWKDGLPVGNYGEWMMWRPERGLRFAVVSRQGGQARLFDAPTPYAIFHVGNAYEADGRIHLDAYMYNDGLQKMKAMERMRQGVWLEGAGAYRVEYELDLTSGLCTERQVSDRPGEWPRLNEAFTGCRNRWGYSIEAERDYLILANSSLRVLKYDRHGGPSSRHDFGYGYFPGEPVFVPRAGATEEDDGYLLTVVYDAHQDRSLLGILDAQRIDDPPLAKLHLRHRVPAGFHGNWANGVV